MRLTIAAQVRPEDVSLLTYIGRNLDDMSASSALVLTYAAWDIGTKNTYANKNLDLKMMHIPRLVWGFVGISRCASLSNQFFCDYHSKKWRRRETLG